jgi:hypothetical protein
LSGSNFTLYYRIQLSMLVNPANITDKNYKKMSIKVSLNGLVFCSFDTLNHTILSYKEVPFDTADKSKSLEDLYAEAVKENDELKERYDEIVVLHDNNLSTFVPTALFDEDYLGSYLQYNTKVFETDFFAFDEIASYQMNAVYIPYVNINNFFVDEFGTFIYKHAHTTLVSKLLELSKNVDEKKMFVHMAQGHFEIIVVQNQHLLLFNSFDYKNPQDLIYYLLFTAEQLNLNPETMKLEFIGDISEDDAYFKIAYKYIRYVSLFDTSDLQQYNSFSKADNLKHFILFQS